MTAQDEYAAIRNQAMLDLVRDPRQVVYAADAVIAEKDAEIERLKCCGNCEEFDGAWCDIDEGPADNHAWDSCHFTPSRWSERSVLG